MAVCKLSGTSREICIVPKQNMWYRWRCVCLSVIFIVTFTHPDPSASPVRAWRVWAPQWQCCRSWWSRPWAAAGRLWWAAGACVSSAGSTRHQRNPGRSYSRWRVERQLAGQTGQDRTSRQKCWAMSACHITNVVCYKSWKQARDTLSGIFCLAVSDFCVSCFVWSARRVPVAIDGLADNATKNN